ncbi:MAG: hypothetical protein RIS29_2459 [Bacteroidota bacterium]|jgi:hypothetical protein
MQIIQNLACLELVCPSDERRITFSKDVLREKRIKSLFIFTDGTAVHPAKSPKSGNNLTPTATLSTISMYLKLIDKSGNVIIDSLCTDLTFSNLFDLNINAELDYDKSEFLIKSELTEDLRFLLYVLYDTTDKQPATESVDNTESVLINTAYVNKDIKMTGIIPRSLQGKPIKKLFIDQPFLGYFDMTSIDGKRIEMLPAKILQKKTPDEFLLDNFLIDLEKSNLRFPGRSYTYTSYLTFIY